HRTLTVHFAGATPGGVLTAEAFDNPARRTCPAQGQSFVGAASAGVPSSGNGTVTLLLGSKLAGGHGVTVTLTDTQKGTSPFVCLKGGVPLPSNKFKFSLKADSHGGLTIKIHGPGAGTF